MTFHSLDVHEYDKRAVISDDASDIWLELDIDDVSPDEVNEESIERIVRALNQEFYP